MSHRVKIFYAVNVVTCFQWYLNSRLIFIVILWITPGEVWFANVQLAEARPSKIWIFCTRPEKNVLPSLWENIYHSGTCNYHTTRSPVSIDDWAREALADIRKSLRLNSTGLSRELLKLAREANYKESRQCFPASDITLSTRAFRVKYNGSNNSLYALVTAEEQSGRVVAISTNYSPSAVEQHYQYTSNYEERMSRGRWHIMSSAKSYLLCGGIPCLILITARQFYIKTIRECW